MRGGWEHSPICGQERFDTARSVQSRGVSFEPHFSNHYRGNWGVWNTIQSSYRMDSTYRTRRALGAFNDQDTRANGAKGTAGRTVAQTHFTVIPNDKNL